MIYECQECFEVSSFWYKADECHGQSLRKFRCEVCLESYLDSIAAYNCHNKLKVRKPQAVKTTPVIRKPRVRKEKPIISTPVRIPKPILRPAQNDCPICTIARRFGNVVSCICMQQSSI